METVLSFSQSETIILWISLAIAVLAAFIIQRKGREILAYIFTWISLALLYTMLATWFSKPFWIGSMIVAGIVHVLLNVVYNTIRTKKTENK